MKLLRSARWLVLAILLSMIPVSSHAEVFISVAIAPPPLLVYDQPLCPEPGWIWTPGYWAYDYNYGDYYWVPGTWIPAPYVGALWTPGYWGWGDSVYIWHPGYWGRHVGYYGGVNYGFGYFGIGFAGGEWRGNRFAYNTAVWRVDRDRIRDVYEDRRIGDRYTIRNDRHVAYSGGPGGIRHDPTGDERNYMREEHMQPTNFQQQHQEAAVRDRNAFYNNNRGRPATVVADRPMTPRGGDARPNDMNNGARQNGNDNRNAGANPQIDNRNNNNRNNDNRNPERQNNQGPQYAPGASGTRPNYGNAGPQNQPQNQPQVQRPQYNNPGPQNNNRGPESNMRNRAPERQMPDQIRQQPAPQPQQAPQQMRPEPQMRQAPPQQMRQQPQVERQMPQQRPQPEARPAPQPRQQESRPAPQQQRNDRGDDRGNDRGRR